MIPKIIHYCWFGGNQKSEIIKKCIITWQKCFPGFEIKEWNENNTKQYQNKFFKDALRKRKYAFVADYVRVKVLFENGGIYLDTDMLLLKPLSPEMLNKCFFSGNEVEGRISFGVFGGKKGHRFFKKMIDFYDDTEFNEFSPPVITHTFSSLINKRTIKANECIYDPEYFYPLPYEYRNDDYRDFLTERSYAVHLWDHSWKINKTNELYSLLNGLKIVLIDFLFYNYSKQYFIRYIRGFSRQVFYKLIRK